MLRHSPIFLIGLFPIVLILWAWADSMKAFMDWRYCRDPRNQYWIEMEASGFSLGWRRAEELQSFPILDGRPADEHFVFKPFELRPRLGEFRRRPVDLGPGDSWFPRLFRQQYSVPMIASLRNDVTRSLHLPHWVILVCYVPAWGAASVWQLRRIRRKAEAAANGKPHSGDCATLPPRD